MTRVALTPGKGALVANVQDSNRQCVIVHHPVHGPLMKVPEFGFLDKGVELSFLGRA